MSERQVTVKGQSLPVRELKGQNVVTISDIANVHQVEVNNIQKNFSNNKKHFVEGIDYHHLKGRKAMEDISIGSKQVTQLNVFTESGYLMLVKSLTDDLSWQVQRELVNSYFKGAALRQAQGDSRPTIQFERLQQFLPIQIQKMINYRYEHKLTQEETGKLLGVSKSKIQEMERKLKEIGYAAPAYNGQRAKIGSQLQLDWEV